MMRLWRVFITRQLPEDLLAPLVEVAEVDVWPDRFSPPYAELRHRIVPCPPFACHQPDGGGLRQH